MENYSERVRFLNNLHFKCSNRIFTASVAYLIVNDLFEFWNS